MSFRISLENSEQAFDAINDVGVEIGDALLTATLWGIGFGAIAFIITVITLIIVAKKRLLTRPGPYWKWVGHIHYLLIAISLLGGGLIWGVDKGLANYAHRKVDQNFRPFLQQQVPLFREFLSDDIVDGIQDEELLSELQSAKNNAGLVVDILLAYYLDQEGELSRLLEKEELTWTEYGELGWHWGRAFLVREVLAAAIKRAVYSQAEKIGLDEYDVDFILNVIKEFDFKDLDQGLESAAIKATHKAFDVGYKQLRNGHLLTASLPLLLVILDLLFFRALSRRRITPNAGNEVANV